jgi:hypothetical protein
MRKRLVLAAVVLSLACCIGAQAQEHWTEGPVWEIQFYRTTPGHFDDYMEYIRTHVLPLNAEAKKQGLVLDDKVFVKTPTGPDDWDVAFATLHKNMAALDYNAEVDAKGKAISEQHFKTADEKQQAETMKPRLEMRRFLGSMLTREVTLKPMP